LSEFYPLQNPVGQIFDTFLVKDVLKQREASSPLLSKFSIEYSIRSVHVDQAVVKLNGKYKLPVYADEINILGEIVHTVQKNKRALLVASKKTGLEVNADKTRYMVMSRDWGAGRSHNIKFDNIYFERVEQFEYL
jgi:hypothetical protein